MADAGFLLDVLGPEWAAAIILGYILYEVHAPSILGRETALSPLLEVPERIEDVEEKQEQIIDNVEDIDELQSDHVQVTRATARAADEDVDENINSDAVDEYLVKGQIPIIEIMDGNDSHKPADD